MRREQKLLITFLAVVMVPVSIVWFVAWPMLHAWNLPVIVGGKILEPAQRVLTHTEVQEVNRWLQAHETGWRPSGEHPPAVGVPPRVVPPAILFVLQTAEGKAVTVSIWRFDHDSDLAGIQTTIGGAYRMRSLMEDDIKGFLPLDARLHG